MSPGTDAAAVPAAGCLPALPQEVVAEILARVPPDVAFLFRCAVVSKLWLRVLTDPAFLRRLLPESCRRSSSLLGFIAERRLPLSTTEPPLLPSRAPAFVPAPGSALGPAAPRSLASFVRDDAGVLDHAEPLAAHDGLLLLRICISPRPADHDVLRLCVCNLLTGRLDVLPPLDTVPFDGEGVRGYAVVTATDRGAAAPPQPADYGYSTSFQVLLIGVHTGDNQLHLHRFSSSAAGVSWIATPTSCFRQDLNRSATPSNCCLWNAATNTDCHRRKQQHLSHGCRAATICCGTAYWILRWGESMFIHHVSLDDSWHFGTNKLMIDVFYWFNARLCLSVVDAKPRLLSLVYVREDFLVTWTQRDGAPDYRFGFELELDGLILVNIKRGRSTRVNSLATMGFGEKSGTVFVLYDSDADSACVVDLRSRSKTTTKVTSWNESFEHRTAVPYEVNWPVFFMSRLGTRL